jgi:hypothetical protein
MPSSVNRTVELMQIQSPIGSRSICSDTRIYRCALYSAAHSGTAAN